MIFQDLINVRYEDADCVALTLRAMAMHGLVALDPRQHPDAWVAVPRADALAITYRSYGSDRGHIAPVMAGYVIEARRGHRSTAIPLDRLLSRHPEAEFWRPA